MDDKLEAARDASSSSRLRLVSARTRPYSP
jgi:hypothetical protein